MMKGCNKFFKRNAIHDFNAFFNAESIDCFFDILYSSWDYLKKTIKKSRKIMFLQKTLYLTEFHSF